MTTDPDRTPADDRDGEWLTCPGCRRRSLHVPAGQTTGWCALCEMFWVVTAAVRAGRRR